MSLNKIFTVSLIDAIKLDYYLKNRLLNFLGAAFFKRIQDPLSIKKIIILRTGSLGDSLCAIPAIENIRNIFKNAQITILTNAGHTSMVNLHTLIHPSLIDKTIDYFGQDKNELYRMLKKENYDLFIELPQSFETFYRNLRNMIVARSMGCTYGFGWEVSSSKLLKRFQGRHFHFQDEHSRLLKIIQKNGFNTSFNGYRINITEKEELSVNAIISENNLGEKNKNIALVIGAKRETNRWPIENFIEVARSLSVTGFNIIVIGSDEDKALVEVLGKYVKIADFTGRLSPIESALMLKHCCLTVSNDTGPMHLSYVVGTPVIAIFSNRDYSNKWYPPAGTNYVFRAENIKCTICLREKCNKDLVCLKRILVKDVLQKCDEILKNNSSVNF